MELSALETKVSESVVLHHNERRGRNVWSRKMPPAKRVFSSNTDMSSVHKSINGDGRCKSQAEQYLAGIMSSLPPRGLGRPRSGS